MIDLKPNVGSTFESTVAVTVNVTTLWSFNW